MQKTFLSVSESWAGNIVSNLKKMCMCVCMCVHSCLYLFVVESLKAYPAAGKLPKAMWCGEEAVGGSGGEVK